MEAVFRSKIRPDFSGEILPSSGAFRSCSNFSVCIGYDIDLGRNICVCPLNRTDSRCLISFDPCTEVSPNRHGQCVPVDECYDSTVQFRCVFNPGWSSNYCEKCSASINMSFVDEIKMPSVKIALIHLILPHYGSICHFTTNGYAMSLDAILGSHVRAITKSIFHQTIIIKISVLLLELLIGIVTILNIFATYTFTQKRPRQIACGWYLLISSFLGRFTMITLMFKIIFLVHFKQGNITCSLTEFQIQWLPTSFEWLHARVSIERALAVLQQARYSNQASLCRVKWIVSSLFLAMAIICSPELIFRRILVGRQDQRTWCVFTFSVTKKYRTTILYGISNLLLFIMPLTIDFITSIIIIIGTLRLKENTTIRIEPKYNRIAPQLNTHGVKNFNAQQNKNNKFIVLRNRLRPIKRQLIKYKHILIAPTLLGVFSMSRVVMVFTFVCTKLDQSSFFALFAYLIGFFPSTAILFTFVLSSREYRQAYFM
ncbi:unnamed protein product [Rotaria magnacalcarata]